MSDASDVVSAFYDRLILRDLLGKVVPGSIVTVAAYAACLSTAPSLVATVIHLGQAPLGLWVVLASVGWFAGVALQAAGETLRVIRYYPRHVTLPEFMKGLVELHDASAQLRQAHERFVVIKEASGNGAVAIVVASVLIGLRMWRGQPLGHWWLGALALLVAVALFRMHRLHLDRQREWTRAVTEHGSKAALPE